MQRFPSTHDQIANIFTCRRNQNTAAKVHTGRSQAFTAWAEVIRRAYAWDAARAVSSHNDPVPRNVLFDGERQWLIDWESACSNDPLVDAAIMLDNFAPSPELEGVLLRAWLGRPPGDAFHAQLAPVRALTRLYYAGLLPSASAAALGKVADDDLSVPILPEFQRAIRERRIKPGAPATKHILGKMFLASFLSDVAPPGLDAAVS